MTKVAELIKRWSEISIQLENLENTKKTLLAEQMTLTEQLVKLSDNLDDDKPKKTEKSKKSDKSEKSDKKPPIKSEVKKPVKKPPSKKQVMKASETSDSDTSDGSES
jgi:organic radical activating enzyme